MAPRDEQISMLIIVNTNEDLASDLKKREYCSIIPFLTSCISCILLERYRATRETEKVSLDEHRVIGEIAATAFAKMLKNAVDFCNSKCNRGVELEGELNTYCSARSEEESYAPLATALNTIMLNFRENMYNGESRPTADAGTPEKQPYSCIPGPSSQEDAKGEIIFTPMGRNAKHTKNTYQYVEAERTPDVDAVFLSDLKERYKDSGIASEINAHCMTTTVKMGIISEVEKDITDPFAWIGVQQTWDVNRKPEAKTIVANKEWKFSELINLSPELSTSETTSETTPETSLHDTPKTQTAPVIGKRSRGAHDDGDLSEPKQPRSHLNSTPRSEMDLQPPIAEEPHKDDVQCGRYATERLSSGHCISGSSIALLDQFQLSFRWYDAQRCTESYPFDILQHLPFSVVSTMIFQRFTAQNWSLFQKDQAKLNISSVDYYLEKTVPLYQLHGRRMDVSYADSRPIEQSDESNTSRQANTNLRRSTRNKGASPSQVQNDAPSAENSSEDVNSSPGQKTPPFCCKIYWPEINHDKEPMIIAEAIKRATLHLPEGFRDMVLKHIPQIADWEEHEEENTYEALLHAKLAGATIDASDDEIVSQGCTLVVMISRTLQKVDDLTPAQFWKAFWDIVRCLYLLWKLGIAHGDASITNMMCKKVGDDVVGVLNDFDLAAIMKIGDRSPKKAGFVRTGTLPFMALDVLEFYEGQVRRWFRHDLESSTWCLVWRTLLMNPSERERWCTGTFKSVFAFKSVLLNKYETDMIDGDWKPYSKAVRSWLTVWWGIHKDIYTKIEDLQGGASKFEARDKMDREDKNESSMRASVEAVVKGIRETAGDFKPEIVDALVDTSWIDVQLINVLSS